MRVDGATPLLIEAVTDELANGVWNIMLRHLCFFWAADGQDRTSPRSSGLVGFIAERHFRFPIDKVPGLHGEQSWLRDQVLKEAASKWSRLYDLIELLAASWEQLPKLRRSEEYAAFARDMNELFEEENIGYRLHDCRIIPITNAAELRAISEARELASDVGLCAAREHLTAAANALAVRPNPDYRNCIKEAISAVEAVSSQLAGEKRADLHRALGKLEAKAVIHSQLKAAFTNMYNYTSGESGIRHCIMDETDVGLTEAKFMLVACSAFVHYLIMKARAAGLLTATEG